MRIFLHCGSGNLDRPNRWSTINAIFSNLGGSLLKLNHDVFMMVHSQAEIAQNRVSPFDVSVCDKVDVNLIKNFNPDIGITWNGNSEGDREVTNIIGREKMIYGELGYFDHYNKTCYFDGSGVNTRHSMIGQSFNYSNEDSVLVAQMQKKYAKSRLVKEPYIFVPLQDETDTQITQYAPFKTMDLFMHHIKDIFCNDDRKILYKVHPKAPSRITVNHPKFIPVTEDIHHYIPYADFVFGLNSTVMVETLLYHERIISYGAGVASRHFSGTKDREAFIAEMYRRQMLWDDLSDENKVRSSYLYRLIENMV